MGWSRGEGKACRFVSGEGCFFIYIFKSSSHNIGLRVRIRFIITQHSRDAELLKSLVNLLGCGEYYLRSNKDLGCILVQSFSDITDKIIPFFQKYPILGVKALDFADFCAAAELIKVKGHLTQEGLEQIRKKN